jgi:hypothetical protein
MPLSGQFSAAEFGERCQQLAMIISQIEARNVDSDFTDWTEEFTGLLLEMKEGCDIVSHRKSDGYLVRRMLESFVRGAQGDPLSVALEEMSAQEQEDLLFKTFATRHLELILRFQRKFNSIDPDGMKVYYSDLTPTR